MSRWGLKTNAEGWPIGRIIVEQLASCAEAEKC